MRLFKFKHSKLLLNYNDLTQNLKFYQKIHNLHLGTKVKNSSCIIC